MSEYCQFCDKELLLPQSVDEHLGYITCGSGKCKKRAEKAAVGIWSDEQRSKEENPDITEMLSVFRSKTPALQESWQPVPVDEHPAILQDPNTVRHMLENGVQAQDSDDPDWWYLVLRTSDVIDAMENEKLAQVREEEQNRVH